MNEPTFIKAAIGDWRNQIISSGRLFEILRVPYYEAYCALLDEQAKTGRWFEIPTERIEELLMTEDLLKAKALADLNCSLRHERDVPEYRQE